MTVEDPPKDEPGAQERFDRGIANALASRVIDGRVHVAEGRAREFFGGLLEELPMRVMYTPVARKGRG